MSGSRYFENFFNCGNWDEIRFMGAKIVAAESYSGTFDYDFDQSESAIAWMDESGLLVASDSLIHSDDEDNYPSKHTLTFFGRTAKWASELNEVKIRMDADADIWPISELASLYNWSGEKSMSEVKALIKKSKEAMRAYVDKNSIERRIAGSKPKEEDMIQEALDLMDADYIREYL